MRPDTTQPDMVRSDTTQPDMMQLGMMQRLVEDNLCQRLAAQVNHAKCNADGCREPERDAPQPPCMGNLPGVLAVYAGVASDTFNKAFGYRGGVPLEQTVAAVRGFFGDRAAPYAWWLGPLSGMQPLDGEDAACVTRLAAHGFEVGEEETGMYLPLPGGGLPRPDAMPGLVIRVADDAVGMAAFAGVVAANWSPPDGEVLRYYRNAASALCAPDGATTLFVAYLDGGPVAVAEVFASTSAGAGRPDVAGLYNVCTLERFRRRGLGRAVTLAALLHARAAGFRHAVLQASGDGYRMYARLGFRDAGRFAECVPMPQGGGEG